VFFIHPAAQFLSSVSANSFDLIFATVIVLHVFLPRLPSSPASCGSAPGSGVIRFHFSGNVLGLQFIVGRTAGSLLLLHARKMFPWMARLEHRLKLAKTVRLVHSAQCLRHYVLCLYPRHSEARLWLPFIVSPFLLDWQLLHRQLTQGFAALELLFVGTLYGPAVLD
jgi:hypothetical protein